MSTKITNIIQIPNVCFEESRRIDPHATEDEVAFLAYQLFHSILFDLGAIEDFQIVHRCSEDGYPLKEGGMNHE